MSGIPKPGHGKRHIGTVYLGGIFVDGGGIEITPTRDGGWVIKHVPPWEPVFEQLAAVANIVESAHSVKSEELKERLMGFATGLANEALGESTVAEE
jgi:hypothetical protein